MQLRSASGRNDFDLIVHAAHAVDRTNRFLRHLLVKIRAEHSGEDDLVFAQFDMDLTARKIRITGKRVVNFGVKMDANVGRAVLVHGMSTTKGSRLAGTAPIFGCRTGPRSRFQAKGSDAIFIGRKRPQATDHGAKFPRFGRSSSPPPEFPAEPRRPLSRAQAPTLSDGLE